MKTIFFLITLLFITSALGQETILPLENQKNTERLPTTRYYFKDINNVLDKFVGTWKYEVGNESLEITFYKVLHEDGGYYSKDELDSNFIYIKNGVTIFDTNLINPDDKYFTTGGYLHSLTKIELVYSEPGSPREWRASLNLDYLPASNGEPEKLIWFVETFAKKTVNGEKVYPFEIPHSLILEKL